MDSSNSPTVIKIITPKHIRFLEKWVDDDSKNRRMRILSKKMVIDRMLLHIVTILLFQNRNEEELGVYEAVGISQYSREDAVNNAAFSIREKYKSKLSRSFEDKMESCHSSHRAKRVRQKKEYSNHCLEISRRYMNASLPNRDPPEKLFDDDEEDNIAKRLWNKLSEKKKIEILDRELEDYFNAPRMNDSEDEFY